MLKSISSSMAAALENGSSETGSDTPVTIGVLALQGAFKEHITHLNRIPGVTAVDVRTKDQLVDLDGLIIPGGAYSAVVRRNIG